MFNLNETSIIPNFVQACEGASLEIAKNDAIDLYKVYLYTISKFLGKAKGKENPTALAIKDLKGNLKIAGIVKYHPNEDENLPGNWSYEITINEEDLEGAVVYLSTSSQFQQIAAECLRMHVGIVVNGGSSAITQTFFELMTDCLLQWLDVNAKEGESVEIENEGYFVASVDIEDGQKIFSVIPDGAMKRLVKGDSDLEEK